QPATGIGVDLGAGRGEAADFITVVDCAHTKTLRRRVRRTTAPTRRPQNALPTPSTTTADATTRKVAIAARREAGSSRAPVSEATRAPSTARPATAVMMIGGDAPTSAVATPAP